MILSAFGWEGLKIWPNADCQSQILADSVDTCMHMSSTTKPHLQKISCSLLPTGRKLHSPGRKFALHAHEYNYQALPSEDILLTAPHRKEVAQSRKEICLGGRHCKLKKNLEGALKE